MIISATIQIEIKDTKDISERALNDAVRQQVRYALQGKGAFRKHVPISTPEGNFNVDHIEWIIKRKSQRGRDDKEKRKEG